MSSQYFYNTLKQTVLQNLRRLTFATIILVGSIFAMDASGQTLTSTTATWASNIPTNPGNNTGISGTCLTGDVNGDGATDLVCLNKDQNYAQYYPGSQSDSPDSLIPSSIFVLESTKGASSGFSTTTVNGNLTSTSLPATTAANIGPGDETGSCALGDFDGDGRDDLACFQTTDGGILSSTNGPSENWPTVWFSSGPPLSLKVASQNLTLPPQQKNGQIALFTNPFSSFCYVGHFMASPGQQILCNQPALAYLNPSTATYSYGPFNNYYIWRYAASYSISGTEAVTETEYNWTGPNYYWTGPNDPNAYTTGPINGGVSLPICLAGDFNGDGLTDLACSDHSGGFYMGLSTGVEFVPASDWSTGDSSYLYDCATGDLNGDGKADIICYTGSSNIFHVYLSTGSGFQPYQKWTFPDMPPPQTVPAAANPGGQANLPIFYSICTTADINADGKTDLLCYANNSSKSDQWIYALSTGLGFTVNTFNSIIPPPYAYRYQAASGKTIDEMTTSAIPFYWSCSLGDFMGNGVPDIVCNPNTPMESYSVGIISRQ